MNHPLCKTILDTRMAKSCLPAKQGANCENREGRSRREARILVNSSYFLNCTIPTRFWWETCSNSTSSNLKLFVEILVPGLAQPPSSITFLLKSNAIQSSKKFLAFDISINSLTASIKNL